MKLLCKKLDVTLIKCKCSIKSLHNITWLLPISSMCLMLWSSITVTIWGEHHRHMFKHTDVTTRHAITIIAYQPYQKRLAFLLKEKEEGWKAINHNIFHLTFVFSFTLLSTFFLLYFFITPALIFLDTFNVELCKVVVAKSTNNSDFTTKFFFALVDVCGTKGMAARLVVAILLRLNSICKIIYAHEF